MDENRQQRREAALLVRRTVLLSRWWCWRIPAPAGVSAASNNHNVEAWFAHSPGVKVVMPSTPADAGDCCARRSATTTRCCSSRTWPWSSHREKSGDGAVEIGSAAVRRPGRDVGLIAYAKSVPACLQAGRRRWPSGASRPRSSTCGPSSRWTRRRCSLSVAPQPAAPSVVHEDQPRPAVSAPRSRRRSPRRRSGSWSPRCCGSPDQTLQWPPARLSSRRSHPNRSGSPQRPKGSGAQRDLGGGHRR